jgi:pyruvate dehydrogenase E1 component beta subunit
MLAAAMADPNPVLIFEHVVLYNAEGDLDAAVTAVDLERACVRRAGRDVTLVSDGLGVSKCLAAADALAADGVQAEVIDLRMLRPLDMDTVTASVQRTRRVVIVDEGWKSGSVSAEIAARLAEHALYELDAPVQRVCSREVPVPYAAQLEAAALPSVDGIVAAVHAIVPRAAAQAG